MGRRILPKSLKSLCLHNIAQNMERVWCADYYKNFHGQGNYLHVLGPFACLTPDLIQELIHCLVVCGWMKRYYLHMLIDWRFESLNLSICKKAANKDSIINLVANRCQKLLFLNISGCNQVSTRMLSDLVQSLTNIVSLSLRHTKCGDRVLTQIGQHCHSLRELDVYGCAVTDMGVTSLCVGGDPRRPTVGEKLLKLDVGFTAVSHGAVETVLLHCRELQALDYRDTCAAVYLMDARRAFDDSDGRRATLRLRTLSAMASEVDCRPDRCLAVACSRCPFVTSVSIHGGVTDDGLLRLGTLDHLRTLRLTNDDREDITFEGGVVPLLQTVGSGLEEFAVGEVDRLDVGVVGRCCPELRKFTCLTTFRPMASFPVHTHPEVEPNDGAARLTAFAKLEELRLSLYSERNDFPASYLRLILNNAAPLRELHLVQVDEFTDDLIAGVLEVNQLRGLERLSLEGCDRITVAPLIRLLLADNDLCHISLRNCQLLTLADSKQLETAALEQRLDVSIEWT